MMPKLSSHLVIGLLATLAVYGRCGKPRTNRMVTPNAAINPLAASVLEPRENPNSKPRSIRIIYEKITAAENAQQWHFFEGVPGQAVDICTAKILVSTLGAPETVDYDPPWPEENESIHPSGYSQGCEYIATGGKVDDTQGGFVGWLQCPSWDTGSIKCREDPKKAEGEDAWTSCDPSIKRIPVAFCDWE